MAISDHVELAESGRQEAGAFTRTWYAVWLVMAGAILLGGVIPGFEPTLSLVGFPDWLSMLVGGFGVAGAAVALFGSRLPPLSSQSWRWESAGVTLLMLGWASFTFLALWSSVPIVIPWLFGLGSVAACSARLLTLSMRKWFSRTVVEVHEEAVGHVRAE